jgi:hypothetical protein
VGGASAVLSRGRLAAFAALAAALVAYYLVVDSLPELSVWWDVVVLAFGLIPAVFALVWLVLPLQAARGLLPLALVLGVIAVLAEVAELSILANFMKLAAVTFLAFWFLDLFQQLGWVVLVACAIPWIDAYSVWRGPTGDIVEHHPHVFERLSFAFELPGGTQAAQLGLPDLMFFALFLAASARFELRPFATWLCMVAALGVTIAIAVGVDLAGLPALPAVSVGFLVANADLLWQRLRPQPAPP